jgi:hypothetical protein
MGPFEWPYNTLSVLIACASNHRSVECLRNVDRLVFQLGSLMLAIDLKHLASVLSGQTKAAAAPDIKPPCNRPEAYSMVREHSSKDIVCRM